jgi:hypothetical protein
VKKITLILLISIYALSVLGYGIKGHYCCGNLKSISFSFTQFDLKSHSDQDCCKTKYQFFKVKDNYVASDQINSPKKVFLEANLFTTSYQYVFYAFDKIIIANPGNPPPLYEGVPIRVADCTFLI